MLQVIVTGNFRRKWVKSMYNRVISANDVGSHSGCRYKRFGKNNSEFVRPSLSERCSRFLKNFKSHGSLRTCTISAEVNAVCELLIQNLSGRPSLGVSC